MSEPTTNPLLALLQGARTSTDDPPETSEPLPAPTSSGPRDQGATVLKNVAASTPPVNAGVGRHIPSACPDALREIRAWLCWKFEPNPKGGKDRKVPYFAAGGRRVGTQGSSDDRRQMVTFDQAVAAANRRSMDGVGFASHEDHGIVVVDFDACFIDGRLHPEVGAVCQSSYAERSPSGEGVHLIVQGRLTNEKDHPGPGKPFGVELFSSRGFTTFSGDVLPLTDLLGLENTVAPVDDALMALVQRRFKRTTVEAAASRHAQPIGLTPAQIAAALAVLDPDMGHNDWLRVGMAIHCECAGSEDGLLRWDEWSSRSDVADNYPGLDVLRARYFSFGRNSGEFVTGGTLMQMANENGADINIMAPAEDFEIITAETIAAIDKVRRNPAALDWMSLPEDPPELPFIIPGWMPDGVVTLFAAHGGTGKSFLSLYIGLCLALGRHPFERSRSIDRVKVLLYSAEDSMLVMQSRIARYLRILGAEPAELAGWLHILDATECDNVLFTGEEKVNGRTTWRFDWLAREIAAFGAQVLIFDNASDAIDANENDRAKVRQFMSALKRLASAVLLLAHVDAVSSMADLADAKGYSGSTAWHNSARSRWFMARVKDSEDVVLTLPKVNYAKAGGEVVIRWSDPHKVFDVVTMRQGRAKAADHRDVLLRLLRDAIDGGAVVSPASNTAASVLNTIKDVPGCPHGLKPADVAREVLRWRSGELVTIEEYKRENRSTGQRIALTAAGRRACEGGADALDFE